MSSTDATAVAERVPKKSARWNEVVDVNPWLNGTASRNANRT
jgi:hypothetical protein